MRTLKSLTLGVLVLLFCVSNVASAQADEVDQLINQLKEDKNWRVRWTAAEALGKIGDPHAVEPLIAALKDWRVRYGAAEALVKIGKPAVEPLISTLEDKDEREYVRILAACTLGKIGDSRAVEPLISALKDENRRVRRKAAVALGKIRDSSAVEPLIAAALKDENRRVRVAAAEALDKLDWKPKNETEKLSYLIARQDWNGCVKIGKPAVEPLITTLLKDNTRVEAAIALGKIGDPRAVEPLAAILIETTLNKDKYGPYPYHLYSPDGRGWQLPWAAAEALGNIGDSRAVESLVTVLKDVDWRVRVAAAKALGNIGDPRAVEPLVAVLKDKDSDVRVAAAKALGNIGDSRAVESLVTVLKDVDWRVRVAAAEALGRIEDPRAAEPLVAALKDESRYVQYKAAKALDKLGRKAKNENERDFYLLFAEDISEILRKRIKVCIGKFDDVSEKRIGRLGYYDPPAKIPYYSIDGMFLYTLKENLISEGYEVIENERDNYKIKIGGVIKAEAKEWHPIRMKDIFSFGLTIIADSFPPFMADGPPMRDYVKIQVTVSYSIDNKVIKKRYIQATKQESGLRRKMVQILSQRISSKMIEDLKKFQR